MSILHFCDIHKQYARRTILSGLELVLQTGHCTLLTGENGTGKTTLLRILGGFEKPEQFAADTGHEKLNWRRYRKLLQSSVMYLHQQPYMFEGSVRDNLAYALDRSLPKAEREQRIRTALEWAGLDKIADTRAKTLSGGEYQRVALARAWLRQPRILLLDEPTANMDREARNRTIELLRHLRDDGMALLIASHDPACFAALINEHVNLSAGRLQTVTPAAQFANMGALPQAS